MPQSRPPDNRRFERDQERLKAWKAGAASAAPPSPPVPAPTPLVPKEDLDRKGRVIAAIKAQRICPCCGNKYLVPFRNFRGFQTMVKCFCRRLKHIDQLSEMWELDERHHHYVKWRLQQDAQE